MRYTRPEVCTALSLPATETPGGLGRIDALTSKLSSKHAFRMPPLAIVVADAIREWFDSFEVGIPTWRMASQDR
ncbi:hypothetical protein AWV80_21845 [Cupriavidus sp. UYMU48A]|nr:hypothetical protein AWV80_21845 [Cupriavidus sp. UYMU48A]